MGIKVFAGAFVDADHLDNIPCLRITTDEAALVQLLLNDIGDQLGGLTCTTLDELSALLADYANNSRSCITYNEKEL